MAYNVIIADTVDAETRSRIMSRIGSKDTKPELTLRKALHAKGFRYRLHSGNLPGKPDLVFPKLHAACFVHGCFWHRHPSCELASVPATRAEFWEVKFKNNMARDRRNIDDLQKRGWRTAVVWECHLRNKHVKSTVDSLAAWLRGGGNASFFESDGRS